MKQNWRSKLMASKAVEINTEPQESQPPPIVANNPKPSKAAVAKAKKAAAAAAAAAAQQNSNNNASSSGIGAGASNASIDMKPNISQLQTNVTNGGGTLTTTTGGSGGPTTSAAANSAAAMNGAVKQEILKSATAQSGSAANNLQKSNVIGGSSQATGPVASSSGLGGAASNSQQQSANSTIPIVATLDPNRIMPVNITLPAQTGSMSTESRVLTIHVPASALQDNQLTQILTAHLISSIMSLPTTLASSVLQQHVNAALINSNMQKSFNATKQLDGAVDTSDEDESEESDDNMDNDDDDDLDKDDDEDAENDGGAEEEPLNSDDDVTDEDASDVFETDNVIVCQYDKITRSRNKWKFYLKDGIMNIGGKDYVFQKSNGDAEW
ncbi:transcription initiation factor IIA subunit 1 isoform X1 [Anastrepha ludens]|uniref:transcription initiation factor IIA subunit 1 isoform X1 n=1 Tax=Anastrepha ludens TaxID=28586 RepID=UPI0023B1CA84|nr:transcription initiation factor IIA subunit 1 isoform X1 [Anastrepha ludens]XP_053969454.1 transcription initiation factor IIA subunit 1 isoform X1 [Anastrepha ludens]XP_053969455.1 transcription initiation factor IIA subunit 1 isoform X1 [Anastrepha ludens]